MNGHDEAQIFEDWLLSRRRPLKWVRWGVIPLEDGAIAEVEPGYWVTRINGEFSAAPYIGLQAFKWSGRGRLKSPFTGCEIAFGDLPKAVADEILERAAVGLVAELKRITG